MRTSYWKIPLLTQDAGSYMVHKIHTKHAQIDQMIPKYKLGLFLLSSFMFAQLLFQVKGITLPLFSNIWIKPHRNGISYTGSKIAYSHLISTVEFPVLISPYLYIENEPCCTSSMLCS